METLLWAIIIELGVVIGLLVGICDLVNRKGSR